MEELDQMSDRLVRFLDSNGYSATRLRCSSWFSPPSCRTTGSSRRAGSNRFPTPADTILLALHRICMAIAQRMVLDLLKLD